MHAHFLTVQVLLCCVEAIANNLKHDFCRHLKSTHSVVLHSISNSPRRPRCLLSRSLSSSHYAVVSPLTATLSYCTNPSFRSINQVSLRLHCCCRCSPPPLPSARHICYPPRSRLRKRCFRSRYSPPSVYCSLLAPCTLCCQEQSAVSRPTTLKGSSAMSTLKCRRREL